MNINPFSISGYIGPEYFCDREQETERVINAVMNQRNLTLLSFRRLGKTGLIFHVFDKLQRSKDVDVFYVDLMQTSDLRTFTRQFAKSIVEKYNKTSWFKSFGRIVKSLHPVISFDPVSGIPKIEINSAHTDQPEISLDELFQFIQHQKKRIIVAFDEFQQIQNYPEKNIEAIFRSNIQQVQNANFIFSGSQKHMLTSMFSDYSRPFYQSTEVMDLGKVSSGAYADFIQRTFKKYKRQIDEESIRLMLDITATYTFYLQFLCNKIFGSGVNKITPEVVYFAVDNILKEQEVIYYNYKKLLTFHQFNLLKAIAKEDGIKQPTSSDFIQKHKLNAASSVKVSLDSLLNKEMIYYDGGLYKVYDIFFSKWLKELS